MATRKIGRPTDNLKDYMLRVRLDSETLKKLDDCCKLENLSRSEVVRKSIEDRHKRLK